MPKESNAKWDDDTTVSGETIIEDDVVATIAGQAIKDIEGVASLGKSTVQRIIAERLGRASGKARGVQVEVGEQEAIVELSLNVIYGFNIPKIVVAVRKAVAARLFEIAGLVSKEINIHVVGVEFPSDKE
jgi:uncharacterized alkaline shock family protein YloU